MLSRDFIIQRMNIDILMKGIGAVGLLCIIVGVLQKEEKKQDHFFVLGGVFLLGYSTWLKDPIFIPLQIVFTGVAVWELWNMRKKQTQKN